MMMRFFFMTRADAPNDPAQARRVDPKGSTGVALQRAGWGMLQLSSSLRTIKRQSCYAYSEEHRDAPVNLCAGLARNF